MTSGVMASGISTQDVPTQNATAANAPVQIVDDLGRTVRLPHPARRVVALYGAFNEMLAAMEQQDIIVARTTGETEPPSIADKPAIGTHMRPNVELVTALAPDLVLQMGGRAAATEPLRAIEAHGVSTACFTVANFEDLFSVIRRLGVLTGSQEQAGQLIADMRQRLDAVTHALADHSVPSPGHLPRVLFEIRGDNLLAAGQDSIVTDVIRHAGGTNAVELPRRVARLGEEEVLRLDPDYYVVQLGPMNRDPQTLPHRPRLAGLRCVREGNYTAVDEALFSRPGPRSVLAVEQLARLLHPAAFEKGSPKAGE